MIEGEDVAGDFGGRGGFGEGKVVRGVDGEGFREGDGELFCVGGRVFAGLGVGTEAGAVAPERNSVRAALDEQRPARERFAGKLFAGSFEDDGAGKRGADEFAGELAGVGEFRRAERGGLPLGAARRS